MEIGLSVKINGGTYGIVHRSVMSDVRLTLESKAIYALLTTECDEFNQVVISNKELSELLEVGEERMVRHRNHLVEHGYITISRNRDKGTFGSNVYTVTHEPKKESE